MDALIASGALFCAATAAAVGYVGVNAWLSDRREQRVELRYREDKEREAKLDGLRVELRKVDATRSAEDRRAELEAEVAMREIDLKQAMSEKMGALGEKGRSQKAANSEQDEAMMTALGGLLSEYMKPDADKEAIKQQALQICGGNVVTLLRLLKKMGVDVGGLMGGFR